MTQLPTVAITGASGFIGSHLARRLHKDGWKVRILVRDASRIASLRELAPDSVVGTLAERAALGRLVSGCSAVVHCAGLVKARSRAEFLATNADGTRCLADAAAAEPTIERFVLLSSLAAREPQLSAYAASKKAAEAALIEAAGSRPWTILRPPAVYGPGDSAILPLFRMIARGVAPMLGPPTQRLSMLHVDDLTDAIGVLLGNGRTAERIYEIDDGEPGGYRWADIVAAVGAAVGTRPVAFHVPGMLLAGVGLTNDVLARLSGRARMLTPGKVREIRHLDWVCSASGFQTDSDWRPRVALRHGLVATAAWYRTQGWL